MVVLIIFSGQVGMGTAFFDVKIIVLNVPNSAIAIQRSAFVYMGGRPNLITFTLEKSEA